MRTRFETEAKANSDMAWCRTAPYCHDHSKDTSNKALITDRGL